MPIFKEKRLIFDHGGNRESGSSDSLIEPGKLEKKLLGGTPSIPDKYIDATSKVPSGQISDIIGSTRDLLSKILQFPFVTAQNALTYTATLPEKGAQLLDRAKNAVVTAVGGIAAAPAAAILKVGTKTSNLAEKIVGTALRPLKWLTSKIPFTGNSTEENHPSEDGH